MSNLFTAVSAEQQEIVAGGSLNPTASPRITVAPFTVVQIAGIDNKSRGGRTSNRITQSVDNNRLYY